MTYQEVLYSAYAWLASRKIYMVGYLQSTKYIYVKPLFIAHKKYYTTHGCAVTILQTRDSSFHQSTSRHHNTQALSSGTHQCQTSHVYASFGSPSTSLSQDTSIGSQYHLVPYHNTSSADELAGPSCSASPCRATCHSGHSPAYIDRG